MRATVERSATAIGSTVVPQISFTGDLDMATAGLLEDAARDALALVPDAGLVVDMSGVTFADSRGLSTLLTIHHMLEGRPVHLRGAGPMVLSSMQIMKIDTLFCIEPDGTRGDPD